MKKRKKRPPCLMCGKRPAMILPRHSDWQISVSHGAYFCTLGCAADWAYCQATNDIGTVAVSCNGCGDWMRGENNYDLACERGCGDDHDNDDGRSESDRQADADEAAARRGDAYVDADGVGYLAPRNYARGES